MTLKIVVQHVRPPIPTNRFDWIAWEDGQEENGVYGSGPTRSDAVTDLLRELEEMDADAENQRMADAN